MMVILALIVICAAVSTAETRREGREALRPYGWVIGAMAALVWILMIAMGPAKPPH